MEAVSYTIIGLFIISIGLLVRKFPNLISGYNEMPEDKKKLTEKEQLPKYISNVIVFMGLLIIISFWLLKFLDLGNYMTIFILLISFVGVIIILLRIMKYSTSRKKNTIAFVILLGTFIFSAWVISIGMHTKDMIINETSIKMESLPDIEIPISEIKKVDLVYELPKITMKINGYAIGNIKKGIFSTKNDGKVELFIQSKETPYILFVKNNGKKVYYNNENKQKTEKEYQLLKEKLAINNL